MTTSNNEQRDYMKIATQYMKDVLSGRRKENKWIIKAVQRQMRDLEREGTDAFPFYFDEKKANRVCRFIETMPHVKGPKARECLTLEPWQIWILTTVFGWYSMDGMRRRYRNAYIEVGRGNGKSALSSGVILYCAFADHEYGADCYTFATTRQQAGIVFKDAKQMAAMRPAFLKKFNVSVMAHALYSESTNSTVMAQSSEAGTQDGLNIHLGVVDELHAHPTRDLYDVVVTGLGKRPRSLLWCITTAGVNIGGICYERHVYVEKVLEGTVADESQFGAIYTIDDPERWMELEEIRKANPNWGVSVDPEYIQGQLTQALATPSMQNNFKTKHCDVWCNSGSAWLNMTKWYEAQDASLCEDDFVHDPCYIGFDLGAKSDLTALARVYVRENMERGGFDYYFFCKYYMPRDALSKTNIAQYENWIQDGYIKVNEGAMTDYAYILEDIRKFRATRNVLVIGFDPWRAHEVVDPLLEDGAPMMEIRPTMRTLSEPAKQFEALLLDGRLHFANDPVLNWMASNTEAKRDIHDNLLIQKSRAGTNIADNKIDGVMACVTAIAASVNKLEEVEAEGDFDDFVNDMISM